MKIVKSILISYSLLLLFCGCYFMLGNSSEMETIVEGYDDSKESITTSDFDDKYSFQSYLDMNESELQQKLTELMNGIASGNTSQNIGNINVSGDIQKIVSLPLEGPNGRLSLMSEGKITTEKEAVDAKNSAFWKGLTTTITVPIWKIDQKTGNKSSGQMSIICNRNIACVFQEAFTKISEDPSKPPLINGGSYVDKRNGSNQKVLSQHALGGAIDLNVNWNPCYYSSGAIVGGNDKWDCKGAVVPESIWERKQVSAVDKEMCFYEGSPVVTILKQYGFKWGAEFKYNGGGGDRMHWEFTN